MSEADDQNTKRWASHVGTDLRHTINEPYSLIPPDAEDTLGHLKIENKKRRDAHQDSRHLRARLR